jgi:glutamate dehydrogenase/leucine dehydrogenase
MPSTIEATTAFLAAGVAFGPGKAANAGGVSVSGLEQSQNALRMFWTREEVDSGCRTSCRPSTIDACSTASRSTDR